MNSIFSRRVVVDSSSRLTKLLANPTSHSHTPNHHHSFASLYRPNQTRHFRTHYLPSTPSPPPPPASRFDPSLLCRSEKIREFFAGALTNKSVKLGNLVESKVGFFRSQFPRKGFEFGGYSGFQRRGWKNWLQGLSSNDVVLGLLLANAGVFLMWRVFDQRFMINNFMVSTSKAFTTMLVLIPVMKKCNAGDILIARNFGPQFLLKLYFAGALGGSVFYLIHHAYLAASSPKRLIICGGQGHGAFVRDPSRTPGLGASGAVNAIMLLDIFLHPRATLYLEFFIPVPAMLLGIFIIGKDILRITEGDSNISGSAHLGGAAVAALVWARIRRGRFRF
ncbi:hypothetical protein Bca101_066285 [Brassica carinata]